MTQEQREEKLLQALIGAAAEIFARNAEAWQDWRMEGAPVNAEPKPWYESTLKVLEREIDQLWPRVNNRI